MTNDTTTDGEMPAEIDFSKGTRGVHHAPEDATVFVPASIERGVWDYFSGKAQPREMQTSELLTEILRPDIEIGEALK